MPSVWVHGVGGELQDYKEHPKPLTNGSAWLYIMSHWGTKQKMRLFSCTFPLLCPPELTVLELGRLWSQRILLPSRVDFGVGTVVIGSCFGFTRGPHVRVSLFSVSQIALRLLPCALWLWPARSLRASVEQGLNTGISVRRVSPKAFQVH